MTKPTEGPYSLRPGQKTGRYTPNGAKICAADGSLIATVSRKADRPIGEKMANARLLAKSWEMRGALIKAELSIVPNVQGDTIDREDVLSEIRAILRSIDGEANEDF